QDLLSGERFAAPDRLRQRALAAVPRPQRSIAPRIGRPALVGAPETEQERDAGELRQHVLQLARDDGVELRKRFREPALAPGAAAPSPRPASCAATARSKSSDMEGSVGVICRTPLPLRIRTSPLPPS